MQFNHQTWNMNHEQILVQEIPRSARETLDPSFNPHFNENRPWQHHDLLPLWPSSSSSLVLALSKMRKNVVSSPPWIDPPMTAKSELVVASSKPANGSRVGSNLTLSQRHLQPGKAWFESSLGAYRSFGQAPWLVKANRVQRNSNPSTWSPN